MRNVPNILDNNNEPEQNSQVLKRTAECSWSWSGEPYFPGSRVPAAGVVASITNYSSPGPARVHGEVVHLGDPTIHGWKINDVPGQGSGSFIGHSTALLRH